MKARTESLTGALLRLTLDLYAAGEAMMRERLRRAHPDDSPEQLEARLGAWLQTRPGAEQGDADGLPRVLPVDLG